MFALKISFMDQTKVKSFNQQCCVKIQWSTEQSLSIWVAKKLQWTDGFQNTGLKAKGWINIDINTYAMQYLFAAGDWQPKILASLSLGPFLSRIYKNQDTEIQKFRI